VYRPLQRDIFWFVLCRHFLRSPHHFRRSFLRQRCRFAVTLVAFYISRCRLRLSPSTRTWFGFLVPSLWFASLPHLSFGRTPLCARFRSRLRLKRRLLVSVAPSLRTRSHPSLRVTHAPRLFFAAFSMVPFLSDVPYVVRTFNLLVASGHSERFVFWFAWRYATSLNATTCRAFSCRASILAFHLDDGITRRRICLRVYHSPPRPLPHGLPPDIAAYAPLFRTVCRFRLPLRFATVTVSTHRFGLCPPSLRTVYRTGLNLAPPLVVWLRTQFHDVFTAVPRLWWCGRRSPRHTPASSRSPTPRAYLSWFSVLDVRFYPHYVCRSAFLVLFFHWFVLHYMHILTFRGRRNILR